MRMKLNVFLFAFMLVSLISLVSAETDTYTIRWIVPDTSYPTWTSLTNKTITQNQSLSHTITATDNIGISCYTVNDTTNFKVSCSGVIQNNSLLNDIRIYYLNVTANDTSNNLISEVIWINVTQYVAGTTTITATQVCRYKKFGYYNPKLPWFRQENCI